MPRRDPRNERGPQPGFRQRNRKRPCPNCPPEVNNRQPTREIMSATGQGTALWSHVCIGTGTCISMIEQYAAGGLPGDPLKSLISFRDRLQTVINKLEASNAVHTTQE